jgi:TPR repeat protein
MASKKSSDHSRAEVLFRAAEILEEMGDLQGAFRCLLGGAELGHDSSQLNLGNMYAAGLGTKKNLKLAADWYARAYRNGNVTAAFNLAIDKRRQGDVRSAVLWLKKALAKNHGGACIELAEIYARRPGMRPKARDLLERALKMSSDDITEDEKERAKIALQRI